MDDLTDIWDAMPVFPLPGVVLMPGETMPLQVFEPRYRALVDYALAGRGVFAMATLKPGFEVDYEGSPPIYREVGLGKVIAHQPLEDGRSNVLIQYLAAALVDDELGTDHLFRLFSALEVRREPAHDAVNRHIRVLLTQLGMARHLQVHPDLFDLRSDIFLDAVAREVVQLPDRRRAFLVTVDPAARAFIVEEALASFLMVEADNGQGLEA